MKKIVTFLLFGFLLCLGTAVAQTTPEGAVQAMQQAGARIAFMNFALVLEGTEEAKGEIAQIRDFMTAKQRDFDSQSAELQQLNQQFENQRLTLNAQTQSEMQRTIQEKTKAIQRFQEDTQTAINQKRDELFARLTNKVQPILSEYAQQNNYIAIFFLDQLNGYFSPALDVTQEIIRIYNERHPSPAAAGSSTPQ